MNKIDLDALAIAIVALMMAGGLAFLAAMISGTPNRVDVQCTHAVVVVAQEDGRHSTIERVTHETYGVARGTGRIYDLGTDETIVLPQNCTRIYRGE